ncbi:MULTISPECIES: type II toxin-antitoxin system death-on-curing family toxin [Acidobacteriaceae]|uniref:type II toxin-antitoxin system death-on-curing family toxin n=1 Tax=Acidobacteriaceae TaxID=204434 RepID=UPI00131E7547|nr:MULTISPECIES: type II toxin-antitoxin system death-on-curing family toxin [Acidobacteriaceae]MDW5265908.1 type II toxin-antitoxin system death-on-curing family toxin [Edaphobacter sp.]
MKAPIWIDNEEARVIHQLQLAEHGGATGIRDQGLFESAMDRPRNLFAYSEPTATLYQLAASYAYGLAKNHAFVDGNKRTAFVVCLSFLKQNGIILAASQEMRYLTFYALAAGDLTEAELAGWLQQNSQSV